GDFAFRVGLPGKSGVGGGILAIAPRRAAIAVWSPGLNNYGNSLVGSLALERLAILTGWSVFLPTSSGQAREATDEAVSGGAAACAAVRRGAGQIQCGRGQHHRHAAGDGERARHLARARAAVPGAHRRL